MVRVTSLFSQLLEQFPRTRFSRLVAKHGAERGAKGFTCWTQFVSMLFCHLARADSLREICGGLACCQGKLRHVGIFRRPNKSTLSYANAHRPAALFEDLFWDTLNHFRAHGGLGRRKTRFRFKNKLLSLDSTTVSLCLDLFPWAKFRRAKGGVKIHVLLDHDDYMPSFVHITEARKHDRTIANGLRLVCDSIVAMDRAYNDYDLFGRCCDEGVWFVTRLKEGALFDVVEVLPIPDGRAIVADELIELTSDKGRRDCPYFLRRVVVWDAQNEREIVLLTNHLNFGATTVAAIYKDRWEIELFFNTIKQHLKIKTFVGTCQRPIEMSPCRVH